MKKERNSSIELLKVLAIIIIIISHSIPFYGNVYDLKASNLGGQHLLFQMASCGGKLGNIIFIICSGYFLSDSKKLRLNKITELLLDTAIIIFGFCCISFIKTKSFSISPFLYRMNLILNGKENWFIINYLLLYLFSPILNCFIKHLSQIKYLLICIIFVVIYSLKPVVWYLVFGSNPTYNFSFRADHLVYFVGLYLIINYIKMYGENYRKNTKLNVVVLLVSCIITICALIFVNFLGVKFSRYAYGMDAVSGNNSIFLISIAVSLFNIFSVKEFKSTIINTLSSLSLFAYVFSENFYTAELKIKYFTNTKYNFISSNLMVKCFLLAVVTIIVSFVVGLIYKYTIKKVVSLVNDKTCFFIEKNGKKLLTKIIDKTNNEPTNKTE